MAGAKNTSRRPSLITRPERAVDPGRIEPKGVAGARTPVEDRTADIRRKWCKKAITPHRSVQCQTCELWVHPECENISDEFFRILADPDKHGGACWNCPSCLASSLKITKMVKLWDERLAGVETRTEKNTTDIRNVNMDVAELKKELEAEKARNREADKNRDDKYVSREEYREREARRCNVIMHRVKEAGEEIRDGNSRKEFDMKECEKVLRALQIREGREVVKICRRIGEAGTEPEVRGG